MSHEFIARVHALELFILFGRRFNCSFIYSPIYLSIYSLFNYVLNYWFYFHSRVFLLPYSLLFYSLVIRINIVFAKHDGHR